MKTINLIWKCCLFIIFGVIPMYIQYQNGCREITVYNYHLLFASVVSIAYNIPNALKGRVAHGN